MRRLTVVGRILRADRAAREAYAELRADEAFGSPLHWGAARRSAYDALLLPGGHRARGMRPYLESPEVQQMAVDSFRAGRPVGAICHGVLVAARALDPVTGRSVLHGRRTTALTWSLERKAWGIARYSRFWDANYYRTYVEEPGQPWGYLSVQQEVTRRAGGSHRLPGRREGHTGPAPQDERACSGHVDRRAACVGRPGRHLCLGPLARRCVHVRPDAGGGAARAGVRHLTRRHGGSPGTPGPCRGPLINSC